MSLNLRQDICRYVCPDNQKEIWRYVFQSSLNKMSNFSFIKYEIWVSYDLSNCDKWYENAEVRFAIGFEKGRFYRDCGVEGYQYLKDQEEAISMIVEELEDYEVGDFSVGLYQLSLDPTDPTDYIDADYTKRQDYDTQTDEDFPLYYRNIIVKWVEELSQYNRKLQIEFD